MSKDHTLSSKVWWDTHKRTHQKVQTETQGLCWNNILSLLIAVASRSGSKVEGPSAFTASCWFSSALRSHMWTSKERQVTSKLLK